ncbi:MAG: cadherin-like beta sandwich domain-containing protein, partial [Gammaproteobacteria bacterium]
LPEGGSLTFSIVVTATDNSTTKTYTLKVNRAIGAPGAPAAVTAAAGARADRADITWTPPTDFGGVSLTEASITAYRVRWRISDTDSGMPGAQPGDWLDSAGADAECNNADAADDAMCGEDPRSGSAYTISGLTNDTQHDVAVSAINSAGAGEWSGGTAAQITPNAEKDETLSELAITGSDASTPALSPVFDADTTAYTAAVVNASISATVTATPTGDNATFSVKVGDADAASGAAGMPSAAGAIDQGDSLLFVIVVTAESGGAVQTYSVTVTRAPGAPGAPQNVGATAGARSGNADITWKTPADFGDVTADATSLTSYRVRWRISDADSGMNGAQPGMWQDSSGDDAECNDADTANDAMCGEETSGDARHTLSGLTDDAQYDVAVAAINSAGAGEWSGDTDARVIPNDRRDAFLSALAVTGSDGAAQVLTKTGRRSDAGFEVMHLTYEVSLEAAVTSVSVTPTLSASGASITLNGAAHASGMPGGASARIDAGGSVTFNVLVTATGGDRNAYVVVVKRPLAAPAAPVARVEIGDLRLTLHWEASADPEGSPVTGYRTQVRAASYSSSPGVVINPGPWSSVADVSGGASARSHAFLNAFNSQSALRFRSGRPYDMQVAAVNTAGQGPWTLVSATAAAAAAPAKPLPVITDNAALTLTWAMPAANRAEITNYHVRWRTAATDGPDGTPGNTDDVAAGNWQGNTAAAGEPMVIGDTADGVDVGALLTHSIAGLTVGAAYDFQVRARNRIGNGEWSDSQSATIVAANIATLSALSINDGSNSLLTQMCQLDLVSHLWSLSLEYW